LVAVVIGAGVVGLWWAWRRGAWALPVYVATAVIGCLVYVGVSSPWVGGKTLAMASPAVLAAAFAGCGALLASGRLVETSLVVLALAAGVIWSNVDQYHDVWLAPRGQLHELETIGRDFAGDGPALMTTDERDGARRAVARARADGRRFAGRGPGADDPVRAVRRAPLPASAGPGGRLGAATTLRLPHPRDDAREGRVGRHRAAL